MIEKPIRVIQSSSDWLTRTKTWLYNQITCLPSDSITSHIVCNHTQNLNEFPIEHLHSFADDLPYLVKANKILSRCRIPFNFDFMKRKIREIKPQIIHSHFGTLGARDWKLAKSANAMHVVSFYGYDASLLPKQRPDILEKYQEMFANSDLFLAEGPAMGKQLEALGCPANKIRVQHLGIRTDKFRFVPRTWKPGDLLRVLIAGTFVEKKGIPIAIRALGRIHKKHPLQIVVIGDCVAEQRSQSEGDKIRQAVLESGLEKHVEFLGFQSHENLCEAGYQNHLFVSPSRQASNGDNEGGSPVTITEFVASGMPVVSTTHCDIPEVVVDGQTGWLAKENDVESLENKLNQAIDSSDQWGSFLKRGRQHIEKEYHSVTQGIQLASIYKSLLKQDA